MMFLVLKILAVNKGVVVRKSGWLDFKHIFILQIDPYELFNTLFGGSDKLFGDSMGPGGFHYSAKVNDNRVLDIR
jgi:hypothetical protein